MVNARLHWQLACQFSSANHLSYRILSYSIVYSMFQRLCILGRYGAIEIVLLLFIIIMFKLSFLYLDTGSETSSLFVTNGEDVSGSGSE